MLIIGHEEVEYEPFYFIRNIDDIEVTPSNSTVIFEYSKENLEMMRYCVENSVSMALICEQAKDVLLAYANGASYIVCDKDRVELAQKFADEYMFDAKILLYSSNKDDLLWAGKKSIDGILFEEGTASIGVV